MSKRIVNTSILVLLVFVIASCTPHFRGNVDSFKESLNSDTKEGHFIEMPFFKQKRNMCGPAAVASFLKYYGINIQLDIIEGALYRDRIKGTLAMDIPIFLRLKGLASANMYKGTFEDLKHSVSKDRPVIVHLDVGLKIYPKGHYAVVTGFSDKLQVVTLHYGSEENKVMKYKKFLGYWSKTNYTAVSVERE